MEKKSLGAKPMGAPAPVWLVGTYDSDGKPNLVTVAWGGTCCSDPPALTISLRKSRHSYNAIVERKAFTVNVPNEAQVVAADFAGIASGRDTDKFASAGLTPVRSDLVDAPYAAEFPLVFECRLLQIVEVGIHTQFIGEIVDVKADPSILNESGVPDAKLLRPVAYSPATRTYYGLGETIGQGFTIGKELMK
ncbi:flavin reductase family protein [Geomonas sp. RF6]|uniref:flavin reductase family protein n=1 Tax=Geomonas sp. RF6 TaxID=2897342 RepID=UPI001E626C52|nr:flavin reductase family protein [Geomonas sp. RF6]UFS70066.1 flavin reductase family protein [Geomonas sp. RF6]